MWDLGWAQVLFDQSLGGTHMANRNDCAICKEEVKKGEAQTLPSGKTIHADHAKRP